MLPGKKRKRESRILKAAALLFTRHGYHETSVEAIAFRADVAVGTVYYLVRRRVFDDERQRGTPVRGDPNIERWGLYLGLLMGVGLSLRNGLKGCFGIYDSEHRDDWSQLLSNVFGPCLLYTSPSPRD